jgi:hypothetical protein
MADGVNDFPTVRPESLPAGELTLAPVLALAAHFDAESTHAAVEAEVIHAHPFGGARGVAVCRFTFTLWNSEAARKSILPQAARCL